MTATVTDAGFFPVLDSKLQARTAPNGSKLYTPLNTTDATGAARAVLPPWLRNYLAAEARLQSVAHVKPRCTLAFDCLAQCGLRDGLATWGQFCIDKQLAAAFRGDTKKGLFFRGSESLPFGHAIRSARELIDYLLTGVKPANLAA